MSGLTLVGPRRQSQQRWRVVLSSVFFWMCCAQLNLLYQGCCAVLCFTGAGDEVDLPRWPSTFERAYLNLIHGQGLWGDRIPWAVYYAAATAAGAAGAAGGAGHQAAAQQGPAAAGVMAFGQLFAAACRLVEQQRLSEDISQSE